MKVWINEALVDVADARISPFDQGFLTGDGVFETLRVVRGVPFALRRHLDRLGRSAAGLHLPCPAGTVLRQAISAVVAANSMDDGRLRVTVTAGPSALGVDRSDLEPTFVVAGGARPRWPASTAVVLAPWPRNERGPLVGYKTISYADNVVAMAFARERGAGEALFANLANNLCEGTATNVFVGLHGRLVTPPLSSGCLPGVTRDLLLELLDAVEDDLPIAALAKVDEAFLSSSTRDVQPIVAIDGRALPACPGPLTSAAADVFGALMARTLDP